MERLRKHKDLWSPSRWTGSRPQVLSLRPIRKGPRTLHFYPVKSQIRLLYRSFFFQDTILSLCHLRCPRPLNTRSLLTVLYFNLYTRLWSRSQIGTLVTDNLRKSDTQQPEVGGSFSESSLQSFGHKTVIRWYLNT